ncbi:hypothetical protein J7E24_07205 [Hymenobacter sp. ISL-91]|uniref:hypothetical protein n=1 Tax=Hymenobacter sp. ISL-91 TaxID=2819151 RepID=UPI001BEBF96F|nr:hypothetical protein [Hymenobacter sp. ISL-91]MBT2557565.1 hypothetical protein [Hymenobacter sp. ISL-91]
MKLHFTTEELQEFLKLLTRKGEGGDLTRFPWLEFEDLADKWNAWAGMSEDEKVAVTDGKEELFQRVSSTIAQSYGQQPAPTTAKELERNQTKASASAVMTGKGWGGLASEHNLDRMRREYDEGRFYYDTPEGLREYAERRLAHYQQKHEQAKDEAYRMDTSAQEAVNAAMDTAYREIGKHIEQDLSAKQPRGRGKATNREKQIKDLLIEGCPETLFHEVAEKLGLIEDGRTSTNARPRLWRALVQAFRDKKLIPYETVDTAEIHRALKSEFEQVGVENSYQGGFTPIKTTEEYYNNALAFIEAKNLRF